MKPFQRRECDDGLHTNIADARAAEAELLQQRQLLEKRQRGVAELRVRKVDDAERLELGNLCESSVIDASATEAEMLKSLAVAQAMETQGRQTTRFVIQEQHTKVLQVICGGQCVVGHRLLL